MANAELRHRALRDAAEPHRLNQFVDPARRDAANPRLLDHRHQRLLRGPPRLKEPREIGALPQLRHAQVQRPEPGLELAVAIAVAPGQTPVPTLVAARADETLDVVLHEQLEYRLGDRAKEVVVTLLL
jgi:hypothetical protein